MPIRSRPRGGGSLSSRGAHERKFGNFLLCNQPREGLCGFDFVSKSQLNSRPISTAMPVQTVIRIPISESEDPIDRPGKHQCLKAIVSDAIPLAYSGALILQQIICVLGCYLFGCHLFRGSGACVISAYLVSRHLENISGGLLNVVTSGRLIEK